jgi:hypothetical protein
LVLHGLGKQISNLENPPQYTLSHQRTNTPSAGIPEAKPIP